MLRRILTASFLVLTLTAIPAHASSRFIVRVLGGLPVVQVVCLTLGCSVNGSLDASLGQVFLVTAPDTADPAQFLTSLLGKLGVIDAEPDLIASVLSGNKSVPPALSDSTPINYYGTTVPHGYVYQPASSIVQMQRTQSTFHVTGAGLVAVIDTGVDPNHPALAGSLVPGHDFTRNSPTADETADLPTQPTGGSGGQLVWTNQNSAAYVTQSTAAVIDGNGMLNDFGHGTMVAGIIHLVAPTAKILPLKAFQADGTGYTSDILRAIYYAIGQHADVIHMSFSLPGYSPEVGLALGLANLTGTICIASAGNNSTNALTYPAAYHTVMGVASTTDTDQLSSFSNYGSGDVWVAAPGEGIVTTYPLGNYAAGWGTSFSAPFVSGTAALMLSVRPMCDQYQSSQALAHAVALGSNLGNGRVDLYQAIQAWKSSLGLLGLFGF